MHRQRTQEYWKRGKPSEKPSGHNGPIRGSRQPGQKAFWVVRDVISPVELCGEHPDHRGDAIDLHYICNRLQDIEVEKRIPGDGAVKPSLQKRSPVFLQDPLGATHVVLTYAGHTGIDSLPEGQSGGRGEGWKPKLLCMGGTREAKDVSGSEESSSLLSREP